MGDARRRLDAPASRPAPSGEWTRADRELVGSPNATRRSSLPTPPTGTYLVHLRRACIDLARQIIDACRHAARQLAAHAHAGSFDQARFAACIPDGPPIVRADVAMWPWASRPEGRSAGERDLALLALNLVLSGCVSLKVKRMAAGINVVCAVRGHLLRPKAHEAEVK